MGKVLLIQPRYNKPRNFLETPSVALLILGTLAQGAGYKVKILHLDIDAIDIKEFMQLWKPDIVGMTVNTMQVKHAQRVAEIVRSVSKDIIIVVGGPHAEYWEGPADEVVIGEGENRWLEILGERRPNLSIDDVPIPDYGLVDLRKFSGADPVRARPQMAIMASRGCPFQCTFCNTPIFWGEKVKYRDPRLIIQEIELLHKKYGVREIFFQDDTFNLNHEWAYEIFEKIVLSEVAGKVGFKITSRANEKLVNSSFLDFAGRAGVWNIFYGCESGSQVMLDRMRKGLRVEEIKRAIKLTHEAGIDTQCSFIVGLPGETWGTLAETQKLITEIKPRTFGWTFACPFPGTEFYEDVMASGHMRDIDYKQYWYGGLYCRTEALKIEDLERFKGFTLEGGKTMGHWADFYKRVCGVRAELEGNILNHSPLVEEVGRYCMTGYRVLEVGAGTGVMGWPFAQGGCKVVSLDNDPEILKMATKNANLLGADIEYIEGEAANLPFGNKEFQVVYSEGLLEHYTDEEIKVLVEEQQRVGEIVVIGVPLEGCDDPAMGDERFMKRQYWEDVLRPFGLRVVKTYSKETRGIFVLCPE